MKETDSHNGDGSAVDHGGDAGELAPRRTWPPAELADDTAAAAVDAGEFPQLDTEKLARLILAAAAVCVLAAAAVVTIKAARL